MNAFGVKIFLFGDRRTRRSVKFALKTMSEEYKTEYSTKDISARKTEFEEFLKQHRLKYGDNTFEDPILRGILGTLSLPESELRDVMMDSSVDAQTKVSKLGL
jgi:hypothetical protein